MTIPENEQRPWHKEPYVWLIIAFPLTAVAGGLVTMWLALNSNDGLVVDDYYKKGLEINRTLDRDHAAKNYQLDAELQFSPDNEIFRILLNSKETFHRPSNISVSFLNATRKNLDEQLIFRHISGKIYQGKTPNLSKGKWYVLLEADDWRLLEQLRVN